MAGVALMLKESGVRVQGSDTANYPPMGPLLEASGIPVLHGYRSENVTSGLDLVVVGNVCRKDNPEVVEAKHRGLLLMSMPQVIAKYFLENRTSLVITGTHGKTTTTALTAWLLTHAGLEPGFLVGGIARNFGSNHKLGSGGWFVIEGDEYDTAFFDKKAKFFHYKPCHAVITSLEYDHADIYPNVQTIQEAFSAFARMIPEYGSLTICDDYPVLDGIARESSGQLFRYGTASASALAARSLRGRSDGTAFELTCDHGQTWHEILLPMWGRHNVMNALAAVSLALQSGITMDSIAGGLASFAGVARRQEVVFDEGGVVVVDDFAHHPTAVRETLASVSQRFPGRRLRAVYHFESNTSRRKVFEQEYAAAFTGACDVYLTYPLVKQDQLDVDMYLDPQKVVDGICSYADRVTAHRDFGSMAAAIATDTREGDVLLAMSGRDLSGLYTSLFPLLRQRRTDL